MGPKRAVLALLCRVFILICSCNWTAALTRKYNRVRDRMYTTYLISVGLFYVSFAFAAKAKL